MAEEKPKKKKKASKPPKKAPEREDQIGETLTLKQEKFCKNYTQNYEFFRNTTLSYADAYGYDLENTPDDDAEYKLKNGDIVPEYDLKSMSAKKKKGAICIGKSSLQVVKDTCSANGSRLRKNDKIQARCRVLLNEFFIDQVIDARLMEVIIGGDDRDSISAAKEYNALKQRVIKKVTVDLDEDLKAFLEKANKVLGE